MTNHYDRGGKANELEGREGEINKLSILEATAGRASVSTRDENGCLKTLSSAHIRAFEAQGKRETISRHLCASLLFGQFFFGKPLYVLSHRPPFLQPESRPKCVSYSYGSVCSTVPYERKRSGLPVQSVRKVARGNIDETESANG